MKLTKAFLAVSMVAALSFVACSENKANGSASTATEQKTEQAAPAATSAAETPAAENVADATETVAKKLSFEELFSSIMAAKPESEEAATAIVSAAGWTIEEFQAEAVKRGMN